MQKSRRAQRMERHHKLRKTPSINLVSLMDIFTILVFFLLVNSSNPQQINKSESLKLPLSTSDKVPEETVVLAITTSEILVQGISVISIEDASTEQEEFIPALKQELTLLAGREVAAESSAEGDGLPITIMGDENASYELVRKILMTCQQSNFTRIAFATTQRAHSAGVANK
jgi:biopolymer transport protein ExbD